MSLEQIKLLQIILEISENNIKNSQDLCEVEINKEVINHINKCIDELSRNFCKKSSKHTKNRIQVYLT